MADNQKHVLIIEDDELIAQMYQASLANAQFQVQLFKDGVEGWNAMQQHTPDLVILDFMMPKLNGIEILQKMRADTKLAKVPAIIMSSLMTEADKQRAQTAGATAYWVKSEISMAEFEQKINAMLLSPVNSSTMTT